MSSRVLEAVNDESGFEERTGIHQEKENILSNKTGIVENGHLESNSL